MIASKVVDSVPLSDTADVNLHPTKKQALDKEIHSNDPPSKQAELSVVLNMALVLDESRLKFMIFNYEKKRKERERRKRDDISSGFYS